LFRCDAYPHHVVFDPLQRAFLRGFRH
jgi:hypothetical protein